MTERLTTADAARVLGVTRRRVVELAASDPEFPPPETAAAGAAHPDRDPLHRDPELPAVGGRSPQV